MMPFEEQEALGTKALGEESEITPQARVLRPDATRNATRALTASAPRQAPPAVPVQVSWLDIPLIPQSVATGDALDSQLNDRMNRVDAAIAQAEASVLHDLYGMIMPLSLLREVVTTVRAKLQAKPVEVPETVMTINTAIARMRAQVPQRRTLIVFDKSAGPSVDRLTKETRKGPYRSRWTEIHPVGSIYDIAQVMADLKETWTTLDRLVIQGHGQSGYLWVGGGTNPTTKYDNTDKAFSASVVTPGQRSYAVTNGLRKQAQALGLGYQGGFADCPAVILTGCNVAYREMGRDLVRLISANVFPLCVVVAFVDYTTIYDDPDNRQRGIIWKLGGTGVEKRLPQPDTMVVAYQGEFLDWEQYQNHRLIGQRGMEQPGQGLLTQMRTIGVDLGQPQK
ncbi:hypothetical protein DI270_007875 [Microbispora triticiradicis]|uniref:Uncharacterized protein n=2 Tax=Microbispora triticiradicis TaxID=2200763 RepID=A0ABX9LNY3_9ACTN|nr:hypothetical protein DI270_007875 [Microbispora triticiradicis]